MNLRRYWDAADAAPLAFRSADESIERFRDTFAAAVSCRLHGARPVSATLSGGLDSSAIVCMARQILPDSFARAYSLVFDELPCDERRYIDAVALASNVKVEYCVADEAILPLDPANPEPLSGVPCDATFAMNFGMLERARRQGVRTMLWGVGGDELLHSGDAYLSDFMRRRRFRALAGAVGDRLRYVGPADLGRCAVACARPLVPARAKTAVRRLHRPPRWIRQDFLREAGALDPSPAPQPRFGSEAQEGIYRSLSSGRTAAVGIPGLDALASAFSMEFRYPFLDRRLVEFVLGLPSDRAELFAGKLLLREAMPGILPELVRNRLDKTGFRPLVERSFDVQAGIIGSLIASSELAQVGAIERRPLEEMLAQQRHRGSERVTNAIASFLRSEMWLRGLRQRQRNRYAEPSGKQLECDEESLLGAAPGYIR